MINGEKKSSRLNYEVNHKKIKEAVERIVEKENAPTVKMVAKEAGVSVATAYSHKCQDMILEELLKK